MRIHQRIDMGIASERFSCEGFGKSKALVDRAGSENKEAGGDKNRRVEIYLLHNGIEFPLRDEKEEACIDLSKKSSNAYFDDDEGDYIDEADFEPGQLLQLPNGMVIPAAAFFAALANNQFGLDDNDDEEEEEAADVEMEEEKDEGEMQEEKAEARFRVDVRPAVLSGNLSGTKTRE